MKKPDLATEKLFNDAGIHFLEERSLSQFKGSYQGIEVDVGLAPETELGKLDIAVSVVNKRQVAVLFTDWEIRLGEEGQKVLTFKASIQTQPGQVKQDTLRGMTFQDFCFYSGNEAIPESYGCDVSTKFRSNALKQDLGWTLPVRLADPLLDSLAKINDSMLSGMLQEAIFYGVYYKD